MSNEKGVSEGVWDSIHVFDVRHTDAKKVEYNLVSTVFLRLASQDMATFGDLDIAGTLSRSVGKF
jgi:hypothetical protein